MLRHLIVILSGPRESNDPSRNANWERLRQGVALASSLGKDVSVIISGHPRETLELLQEFAQTCRDLGVGLSDVRLLCTAEHTFANAWRVLDELVRMSHITDVHIVSSGWHMPRVEQTFNYGVEFFQATRALHPFRLHFVGAESLTSPEFAESYAREEPAKIQRDMGMIQGWEEEGREPTYICLMDSERRTAVGR